MGLPRTPTGKKDPKPQSPGKGRRWDEGNGEQRAIARVKAVSNQKGSLPGYLVPYLWQSHCATRHLEHAGQGPATVWQGSRELARSHWPQQIQWPRNLEGISGSPLAPDQLLRMSAQSQPKMPSPAASPGAPGEPHCEAGLVLWPCPQVTAWVPARYCWSWVTC